MLKRNPAEGRLVDRVVKRLKVAYHPTRIIIFGSYAQGRATAESDLDVLIVKATPASFHRRLFEVRRLVSPVLRGHPFDPIVITPRELRQRLAKGDGFLRGILRTGRVVYEAN